MDTMSTTPKVVALVPAHDEEEIIERTIHSLMDQTFPFTYVLVITNNCTDRTVSIVLELQKLYGSDRLRLVDMPENIYKKSGALNYGFTFVDDDVEFVFSMDADTIVHPTIVSEALIDFSIYPRAGGVCSAYRTLREEAHTPWQRFLWRLQNVEFGHANAWRVENIKSARVLPGVSVMYRMAALKDVQQDHGDGTVWANRHLVEDYELTLRLKDLGWEAKSSFGMISWSDVPLKVFGKEGLWQQRIRWYSGTVDELRKRKLKKHSRYEVFTLAWLMIGLGMQSMLLMTYGLLLLFGVTIEIQLLPLVVLFGSWAAQLYRLKYTDQLDWWQRILTATLIINELYALFRSVMYAVSVYKSYRHPNRAW